MEDRSDRKPRAEWRETLHNVIFEAETLPGRSFDLALLLAIVLSVMAVSLESVASIRARYGAALFAIEWFFTILFTIEYILRVVSVDRPARYVRSFFGIVDLASILPTFLSLFLPGTQSLIVIRALRLLRIFRILKLVHFVFEARQLGQAMRSSARKIVVFVGAVLTVVLITGSLMYIVEGPPSGFTSIPRSVYWAIVTMTTVGYGDIAPQTVLGQVIASVLMICGYGIIAVPTGIVSAELVQRKKVTTTLSCHACTGQGHDLDAKFCKHCGASL